MWSAFAILTGMINPKATIIFICSSTPGLLPPKLQRRGLVFKGKMVTMKRV